MGHIDGAGVDTVLAYFWPPSPKEDIVILKN